MTNRRCKRLCIRYIVLSIAYNSKKQNDQSPFTNSRPPFNRLISKIRNFFIVFYDLCSYTKLLQTKSSKLVMSIKDQNLHYEN